MRSYNTPKDSTCAPSAGGVQNKHHVGGAGRLWLLASLQQSTKSARQSTAAVRGGEQSRPSPSPLRCFRCTARLPHIEADVEQRLTAIRRVWSKDSCLSDCLAECSLSANLRVHGACMVGRP